MQATPMTQAARKNHHLNQQLSDYFWLHEMIPAERVFAKVTNNPEYIHMIRIHHCEPMDLVRELLDVPMWASQGSCFRPDWWEKMMGRKGTSQHCAKVRYQFGQGACDWTFEDFDKNVERFVELVLKHTAYTRICVYPDSKFVHCDFKHDAKETQIFEQKKGDVKWQYQRTVKW